MSIKAMAVVWEAELPRPEKFVLLALADHADHEGGHISPSLGRIAWKTGYSYQKVVSIVKGLRESGILVQTGYGINNVNVYQIQFERLIPLKQYQNKHHLRGKETSPLEDEQGVPKVDPQGGKETIPLDGGVSKLDPLRGKESRPLEAQGVKKLAPGGKESRYKPLKLVNIIKDTQEGKIIINHLSDELKKIGVTQSVSKRLLENNDPKLINEWLELYVQASELGIARSAGWLVSALDHDWSLDAMQQRVEEEQDKGSKNPNNESLPQHLLEQLPAIGWVGGLDKLEQHYQNNPQEFEHWLTYIQKETPEDNHQAGRFLEGLRSGLPAPEIRSERYKTFLSNPESDTNEPDLPENPIAKSYSERWEWSLQHFGIRKGQITSEVVDTVEKDGQLAITVRAKDQQSYHHLVNVVGFDYFSTVLAMVFREPVETLIEEFEDE